MGISGVVAVDGLKTSSLGDCAKKCQQRPNYILNTLEFCIHLDKNLVPRVHETLWKSLAPFWIVSGVGSVQPLINRWRRAKIQLNQRKYQTISKKSHIWYSFTRGMCKLEKKIETNTALEFVVLVPQHMNYMTNTSRIKLKPCKLNLNKH